MELLQGTAYWPLHTYIVDHVPLGDIVRARLASRTAKLFCESVLLALTEVVLETQVDKWGQSVPAAFDAIDRHARLLTRFNPNAGLACPNLSTYVDSGSRLDQLRRNFPTLKLVNITCHECDPFTELGWCGQAFSRLRALKLRSISLPDNEDGVGSSVLPNVTSLLRTLIASAPMLELVDLDGGDFSGGMIVEGQTLFDFICQSRRLKAFVLGDFTLIAPLPEESPKCPSLRFLSLGSVTHYERGPDRSSPHYTGLEHVEKIGAFAASFPSLHALSLSDRHLTDEHIIACLRACPDLRRLDLDGCYGLQAGTFFEDVLARSGNEPLEYVYLNDRHNSTKELRLAAHGFANSRLDCKVFVPEFEGAGPDQDWHNIGWLHAIDTLEEWRQRCIGQPVVHSDIAFCLRVAARDSMSEELMEGLRNSAAQEQGNADAEFGHGYMRVNGYPSDWVACFPEGEEEAILAERIAWQQQYEQIEAAEVEHEEGASSS